LGGIFEVRIYPTEFSVKKILASCRVTTEWKSGTGSATHGVDLRLLNATLSTIDYEDIRRRRRLFSRLYHEAIIIHQPKKGISFTDMLLLLAHHKLIVDNEALVLKDHFIRTGTNKLVTDLVGLDRVRSSLKGVSGRRALAELREAATDHDVPAIVVFEDIPSTPPPVSSRDITSARRSSGTGSWTGTEPETPTPRDGFDVSDLVLGDGPIAGPSSRGGLRRGRMRHSDGSALSADLGLRYTRDFSMYRDSSFSTAAEDYYYDDDLMQDSSWKAMMVEAEQDEQKQ